MSQGDLFRPGVPGYAVGKWGTILVDLRGRNVRWGVSEILDRGTRNALVVAIHEAIVAPGMRGYRGLLICTPAEFLGELYDDEEPNP